MDRDRPAVVAVTSIILAAALSVALPLIGQDKVVLTEIETDL
jgi:hypothetical protein